MSVIHVIALDTCVSIVNWCMRVTLHVCNPVQTGMCVMWHVLTSAYLCSLRDELRCVELCHDALEHLVDDGGQDALVVVRAQLLVHCGQVGGQGAGQHAQSDVHHLEVCTYRVTQFREVKQ